MVLKRTSIIVAHLQKDLSLYKGLKEMSVIKMVDGLMIHYRPFGGGQGAFEITAVLAGGFRACKMDGTVPNGGFACRGLIEGVFVHRRLVEPGGGKSFVSPILVEEGRWLRRKFAVDDCKLGENRLGEELLMVALHGRNADKAGQSVGALAVVGSVMYLDHLTALAEGLPPIRSRASRTTKDLFLWDSR